MGSMNFPSVSKMSTYLDEHRAVIAGCFLDTDPERLERGLLKVTTGIRDAAMRNPSLLNVTPASVLKAAMVCARLNLYPGGSAPDVYLVPRSAKVGGSWVKEIQAQTSWRGSKKLIERAGVQNVRVRPVFRGEPFRVTDGTDGAVLYHEQKFDIDRTWETLIACYVLGKMNGEVIHHVIGRGNIERHRDSSDSWKREVARSEDQRGYTPKGPWIEHPVQMALKTAMIDAVSRGTFPVADEEYEAGLYGEIQVPKQAALARPARPPTSTLGLDTDDFIEADYTESAEIEDEAQSPGSITVDA
jgi:phage RecT family recombinase